MSGNPFLIRYKALQNHELMEIVSKADEYQILAVEAAKHELENRNLSTDQYNQAQQILSEKYAPTSELSFTENIVARSKEIYISITAQDRKLTANNIIDIISVLILVQFLYKLWTDFSLLTLLLFDGESWDISVVYFIIPFIILPVSGISLFLRKQVGWVLTVIHFSFSASTLAVQFITEILRPNNEVTILDNLFPQPSPITLLVTFALYAALTWEMCRKNITSVFKVSSFEYIISFGIGIGLLMLQRI